MKQLISLAFSFAWLDDLSLGILDCLPACLPAFSPVEESGASSSRGVWLPPCIADGAYAFVFTPPLSASQPASQAAKRPRPWIRPRIRLHRLHRIYESPVSVSAGFWLSHRTSPGTPPAHTHHSPGTCHIATRRSALFHVAFQWKLFPKWKL